jgi:hypothetical protein
LLTSQQLEQLFALLNGHIYLTRRALNLVALEDFTFVDMMKAANDSVAGPFSSHLEALWDRLPKQPEIRKALKQILDKGKCDDEKILHRLVGAGLVIRTGRDGTPRARCKLYEIFLKERLHKYRIA